jgi:uncharacterized protein
MDVILKETAHRPWPLPSAPWIMKQVWHSLLFAHWPVDVAQLLPLIPSDLAIHTFEGQAWLGVVPFRMSGVRARATPPLPSLSAFPELNVRTYVTYDGKPGVWFFSLDAANRAAVWAARLAFHLPYFFAAMRCELDRSSARINYHSSRRDRQGAPATLKMSYAPEGKAFHPQLGTIDHFLTERYCLYAADKRGRLLRCEIHHRPWPLQSAVAAFEQNTMVTAAGIALPNTPPLLHFARRQEVLVWAPHRVD